MALLDGLFGTDEQGQYKPVVLVIFDGLGVAPPSEGNAVTLANTPNLDKLWPNYPHTYLQAAGTNVGLPHGTDGNSEVGHINIGAGKVVFQDLPRIDNAIADKSFFENAKLLKAIEVAKQNNSTLHIMGLVGSGEVHSSLSHLFSLLKLVADSDLRGDQVLIHAFTDGRDSPPKSAMDILDQIESELVRRKVGRIASIVGRYYAMDRDERWDRTEKAYNLIVKGEGKESKNWSEALKEFYAQDKYDEVLEPIVLPNDQGEKHQVSDNDAVIFINFRPDRAIQITKAFAGEKFDGFERQYMSGLYFVGMTEYEDGFPKNVAFPPEDITNPLGKILSDNKLPQLRIAESEKFPHVTYFIDGGNEEIYAGQDRIEVPSPKDVATYDQKPEMSAYLVTDLIVNKIASGNYAFVVTNYANADMVAHTGALEASIKAVEVLDECIGRVVESTLERDGTVLLTADHGNAEELIDLRTGEVDTKHSINPVPLMIVNKNLGPRELSVGILADIAPTVLAILGIEQPTDMTGRNLLV
jgi:2,3-bisphosphoglycerate-independent phosphoglycerate mutase